MERPVKTIPSLATSAIRTRSARWRIFEALPDRCIRVG